jgi:glycosyltransferase involved in cell wall biosynthesis/peptidoglycan/xylan/chitin deacetylase (PgdA/CDA1 family)
MGRPVFSIVVPTYRRRDTVIDSVRALESQTFEGQFETIVVVDGSDDGSAEALRALDLSFPLNVIEQPNAGAASARNRGAREAAGEFLLFLDDDMVADPHLLVQHHASLTSGADAVLGHLPLHPDSPRNFLSKAVGHWAEERARSLRDKKDELTLLDLLTGQLSLRRELFELLGGFDIRFTHGGSFGAEDTDFGWRLLQRGARIVFNPDAVSYQRYVVTFRQFLRQWRQAGEADAALARKHPEIASKLLELHRARSRWNRLVLRPLARTPLLGVIVSNIAGACTCFAADCWPMNQHVQRIFRRTRDLVYWLGMEEAGGIRFGRTLRVLAYHSVSREKGGSKLLDYVIEPSDFARQLDLLRSEGFQFVSAQQGAAFLRGEGTVPPRAVLVTFDDGYTNVKEEAAPILSQRRIPAIVFVITKMLGGYNEWDQAHDPFRRALMSVGDLAVLKDDGFSIGAHSRHHRPLRGLTPAELVEEIAGSLDDLQDLELSSLRLFCYPYGVVDDAVEKHVRSAGAQAAFTVEQGIVRPGVNPMRVPRLEILRSDGSGAEFLRKIMVVSPPRRGRGRLIARVRRAALSLMPKAGRAAS